MEKIDKLSDMTEEITKLLLRKELDNVDQYESLRIRCSNLIDSRIKEMKRLERLRNAI